jgi:hypothetical protein
MILYLGAHYLIFLKNPDLKVDKYSPERWRIFNDTQTQTFRKWADVAKYCVEGQCLPTVLLYE